MGRFLRQFAGFTLGLALFVIGLSVLINPYDYWPVPRIEGLNAVRPAGNKMMQVVKRAQYARAEPRTVVAGNSRVQTGIDPLSAVWAPEAAPVYNYGLAGRSQARVAEEVLHAARRHQPDVIYVGVDFVDFLLTAEQYRAPAPLIVPGEPTPLDRLKTFADVSFSLSAFIDTLTAIPEQTGQGRNLSPLGFNELEEYRRMAAREGYARFFRVRNEENFARYMRYPKAVRYAGPGHNPAMHALEAMAAEGRARGYRVVFFTYPYHADILVGLRAAGLEPALMDFRRMLAEFGAREGVEVWDFTRVNGVTTEPVPAPGDRRTVTRYYWEAGHFKTATGDRMIAVMARGVDDPAFGARLTPASLAAADAALKRGIDGLVEEPQRMARLQPIIARARRS